MRVDHNPPPYGTFPDSNAGSIQVSPPCPLAGRGTVSWKGDEGSATLLTVAERSSRAAMRAKLMANLAGYRWPRHWHPANGMCDPLLTADALLAVESNPLDRRQRRGTTTMKMIEQEGTDAIRLDVQPQRAPLPTPPHRCFVTRRDCACFRESDLLEAGTVTPQAPAPPWSVAPSGG